MDIIEPDKKVDLASEEPAISFFNNGRVPVGEYDNFRICFQDHGRNRRMERKNSLETPVKVIKGSFIHVSFDLDLENSASVRQIRLTVDGDGRIDPGQMIADTAIEKG